MARDFIINGETMVHVKIPPGIGGYLPADVYELGLAAEEVRIIPRFVYQDIKADDFGPEIPADVMWLLADVTIRMGLIHYNRDVLDTCLASSMAGTTNISSKWAGTLVGAGTLMGNGKDVGSAGNSFIGLSLLSPNLLNYGWRFPAAYLADRPLDLPLGTNRTIALCQWRAIPYRPPGLRTVETKSTGTILFDHNPDLI